MYRHIVRLNGDIVETCGIQFITDKKFFEKYPQNIEITEDQCLEFQCIPHGKQIRYNKETNTFTIENREVK